MATLEEPLNNILLRKGLRSLERQLQFATAAEEWDWELDQDEGVLRLGDKHVLNAQILATESSISHTWLWSWANESVDPSMTAAAARLRSIGIKSGILTLTEPRVDLFDEETSALLAIASSALLDMEAYYRGPYPGGAVFMLISDLGTVRLPHAHKRTSELVRAAIETVPGIASRKAIENYARQRGQEIVQRKDGIVIQGDGEFHFDNEGRLVSISDDVAP